MSQLFSGKDSAAKKRGLSLAVGGGFVVAARKRDRLEILCRVSVKWRLCGRGDEKKLEKA